MYIDLLILRYLASAPSHGYELRHRIEATTVHAMHNNSLYPALRRFEEAGAVTKTAHPQEGRPPKHVYEITDVGRELLHDMLAELPPELAGDETEFLTRLGLFDYLTVAERQDVLAARDEALRGQLRQLAELAARSTAHKWGATVVGELIRRAEREREWLRNLADPTRDGPE